jgi:hypothetical protein
MNNLFKSLGNMYGLGFAVLPILMADNIYTNQALFHDPIG